MSSSHNQPPTPEDPRPRDDHPRSPASKALAWLGLVAVALFPFPWWW